MATNNYSSSTSTSNNNKNEFVKKRGVVQCTKWHETTEEMYKFVVKSWSTTSPSPLPAQEKSQPSTCIHIVAGDHHDCRKRNTMTMVWCWWEKKTHVKTPRKMQSVEWCTKGSLFHINLQKDAVVLVGSWQMSITQTLTHMHSHTHTYNKVQICFCLFNIFF